MGPGFDWLAPAYVEQFGMDRRGSPNQKRKSVRLFARA